LLQLGAVESLRNPRSKNNTKDGFRAMPVTCRTTPKFPRRELYAQAAVLPSESPNDFAAFFEELCQELKPVGLLEEDQAATVAKLLWRKHRLQIFQNAEEARLARSQAKVDRMLGNPEVMLHAQLNAKKAQLLATYVQEEEEKLDPGKAACRDEKIQKMASEIAPHIAEIEEMLRRSPDETQADKAKKIADDKEQAALLEITVERYVKDLEMMERLDAGVDRALVRLEKYQRRRMTGSLSPPGTQHRAPGWGRVRQ
jgi:hypothetical protein